MFDDLETFHRHLEEFDPQDRVAFQYLLEIGMSILQLSPDDLCELFDVSAPGVKSWLTGATAPHPAVRRVVIQDLAKKIVDESMSASVSLQQALAHS